VSGERRRRGRHAKHRRDAKSPRDQATAGPRASDRALAPDGTFTPKAGPPARPTRGGDSTQSRDARRAGRSTPERTFAPDLDRTPDGGATRSGGPTGDGGRAGGGVSARDGGSAGGGAATRGGPARSRVFAVDGKRGERVAVTVAGTAAVAAAITVVVLADGRLKSTNASKAAANKSATATPATSGARSAAPMAPLATAPGDVNEDTGAIAYYKEKDPRDKVVKHVDEVRWSGRYLRVYTNLNEGDTHSRVALDLCEWTSEYLTDRRGDRDPVVFVHAKKNDNGNVVLVNKLSAEDSCKSVETE
jgi:hypothetical protein